MNQAEQAAFDAMREALVEADDYLSDCEIQKDRKVMVMIDCALSAANAMQPQAQWQELNKL